MPAGEHRPNPESLFSAGAKTAISKALLVVGSVIAALSVVVWLVSLLDSSVLVGQSPPQYRLGAQVLFVVALALLHVPLAVIPENSSTVYLAYANILNVIGVASLAFGLQSWVFLIAGMVMAFLAYFVFAIDRARNTQYLWGNGLVLVGSIFVFQGQLPIGTAVQLVGLFLTGWTALTGVSNAPKAARFNSASYVVMSVWGWILSFGVLGWVFIAGSYLVGFSWLLQGFIFLVSSARLYHGIWPVHNPPWWRKAAVPSNVI